jgi:hypothetical protein
MTAEQRKALVKKAVRGKHIFGGHFKDVQKKAAKRYGSMETGRRVAAAAMWRKAAKKAS